MTDAGAPPVATGAWFGAGGRFDRLARHPDFQGATLGLIVLNALFMGAEAVPALARDWETTLTVVFVLSQAWFVGEIGVRLLAHWPRLRGFFADGWNVFDLTVVVLSLLPAVGGFALAARLLRVLRLLRVVSGTSLLRGYVRGELRAPARALAFVLLLGLSVYVFAIAGFHLFGGDAGLAAWADLCAALASSVGLYLLQWHTLPTTTADGVALLALFATTQLALLALLLRPRPATGAGA